MSFTKLQIFWTTSIAAEGLKWQLQLPVKCWNLPNDTHTHAYVYLDIYMYTYCNQLKANVPKVTTNQAAAHTVAADWHSALLKPSVRRKIMCIPIIYISCVKILRMYSVKNSLRVDGNLLFSHPRGLTGQQHCILTAWGTEQTNKQTKRRRKPFDRLAGYFFCFVWFYFNEFFLGDSRQPTGKTSCARP